MNIEISESRENLEILSDVVDFDACARVIGIHHIYREKGIRRYLMNDAPIYIIGESGVIKGKDEDRQDDDCAILE